MHFAREELYRAGINWPRQPHAHLGFYSSYFSLSTVLNSLMDDLKGEAVGQPWRRVVTEKTLAKTLRLSPRDHPASPAANILESNISI